MKKLAITIYREDPYLELWLTYYRQFFDDLLVFNDNLPDDPSTELLDLKEKFDFRIEDIRSKFDNKPKFIWLAGKTTEWMEFYLKIYDVILFSICDEIIVPLKENLGQYIEHMTTDFARCTGYDVVQQPNEPELNLKAPILAQRSKWAPDLYFNKPLITKIPLTYNEGWHSLRGERDSSPVGDPNLALIHLKRADSKIHKARYDVFRFTNHEPSFEQEMFHQMDKKLVDIPPKWRSRF